MRITILTCLLFNVLFVKGQVGYNCFNQSNYTTNWEYLGPINNEDELMHQRFGNIGCININPKDSNEIFIGSPTGALMHTVDRGKTWHSLTDRMDIPIIGVNDILIDYSKTPYEIMIATGSENEWYSTPDFGIFKSLDGGLSWQQTRVEGITELFGPVYYKFIQYKKLIFCHSRSSILLSKDNGQNWTQLLNRESVVNNLPLKEREIRYIHYEPKENKLYFSTCQKWTSKGNENAKLYTYSLKDKVVRDLTPLLENKFKTDKKGNGMEAIQILPFKKNQLLFEVNHHSSFEVYTYEYDIKKGEIIEYEVPDAGNARGVSLRWFSGFRLNKKNQNIRYIAGVYLYKSTDGGQTYKRLFNYGFGDNSIPHVDIRSMAITHHSVDGKTDHIYLGTDGGLSFSSDGGKTFRNLNGPALQLTQFYGLGSSQFNGMISAGAQDNSIMSYIPTEQRWVHKVLGDGYDVAYSKIKPGTAYGQYNTRLMRMTNNDQVPFSQSLRMAQENSSNRKTIVAHANGDLFFAAQSLYRLPKGEKKWIEHKTILPHKALTMAISPSNPNIIYMSGNWSDLIKSSDGGKTWKNITKDLSVDGFKQGNRIQSICISPYDENRIFIGFSGMGSYNNLCTESVRVIESRDGGKTWTNISLGLPVFAIQDLQFYEGSYESLFAATDQGVYFRRGTGYKWQRFGQQLPKCLIGELNINYCRGKLIAATYGRGLWEVDLPIIQDKNPLIIRRTRSFTKPKGEALIINQDIILRRKGKLIVNCPIYMAKGSKIRVKKRSQVVISPNGKIINGCGNNWLGIVEK